MFSAQETREPDYLVSHRIDASLINLFTSLPNEVALLVREHDPYTRTPQVYSYPARTFVQTFHRHRNLRVTTFNISSLPITLHIRNIALLEQLQIKFGAHATYGLSD
jgi:hypothetical protein